MSQETLEDISLILNFGKHKGKSLNCIHCCHHTYLSMLMFWIETQPPWSKKTNLMECLPYLKEHGINSFQGKIWTAVYQENDKSD